MIISIVFYLILTVIYANVGTNTQVYVVPLCGDNLSKIRYELTSGVIDSFQLDNSDTVRMIHNVDGNFVDTIYFDTNFRDRDTIFFFTANIFSLVGKMKASCVHDHLNWYSWKSVLNRNSIDYQNRISNIKSSISDRTKSVPIVIFEDNAITNFQWRYYDKGKEYVINLISSDSVLEMINRSFHEF